MKNLFTTLLILALSTPMFSQRTATVVGMPDFHTLKNGYVESTYSLNTPLTEREATEILGWAKANSSGMSIVLDKNNSIIQCKFSQEFNQRDLYLKFFYQLSIEKVITEENDQKVTLDTNSFFETFGF